MASLEVAGLGVALTSSRVGAGLLDSSKIAGCATPATVAVAPYTPMVAFAVMGAVVATPSAPVVTCSVVAPSAKTPEAPLSGRAKLTGTLGCGRPATSTTKACNGSANTVPIVVLWPEPP